MSDDAELSELETTDLKHDSLLLARLTEINVKVMPKAGSAIAEELKTE